MKPKQRNNLSAFNWREQPAQIDWKGKTERQVQLDATRQNREATLCAFIPPEHAQKIRKARI